MVTQALPVWRRPDWHLWYEIYMEKMPKPNRRAWVRYPSNVGTTLRSAGTTDDQWQAKVRDISAGGIKLLVKRRFESGVLLQVEVPSMFDEEPRLLLARVLHVRPCTGGYWVVGCAFSKEISKDRIGAFREDRVRPMFSDKRAWLRFRCDRETSLRAEGEGEEGQCLARVLNISHGGIGIRANRRFDPGTLLNVELLGPTVHSSRRVQAKVVHSAPRAGGLWHLGCSFVKGQFSDEDILALL